MKTINRKKVNVTSCDYIYIDGKKISELKLTPLSAIEILSKIEDEEICDYLFKIVNRRWTMDDI